MPYQSSDDQYVNNVFFSIVQAQIKCSDKRDLSPLRTQESEPVEAPL
jgi:hypothetical protein